MNDRDRQSHYDRGQQRSGGHRDEDAYDSPRQANQWQSESYRQQGGDRQQDSGQRGGSDDYSHDYRGSGQSSYGQGSSGSGSASQGGSSSGQNYRSRLSDDDLNHDQNAAARNYQRAQGGYGRQERYGQGRNDDWQRGGAQDRYGQQDRSTSGYAGRDYDASGGNDFGSFTSEDFGGRDFYNRGGGGATGGMRSSESYRPSYGLSSWFNDDDRQSSGRSGGQGASQGRSNQGGNQSRAPQDYGAWRQYGESRGFFQRAGDEIASWFGDEDASRRRDRDHRENHSGRGPAGYTRSDERIREDANDHLTHDWGVDASHITVSVKDGELTLDGTVDSRQAKRRAEDCVEHISGVKHVQNNLRVQDRSSASSTASGYGQSGGASYQTASGSALTGSGHAGSGHAGSGQAGSGQAGSGQGGSTTGSAGSSTTGSGTAGGSSTGGSGTATGANTTNGIGSTASAGVGSASTARSSDKTS